jgi:ABC-type nitrate/sulfonate/bicarbonate transport system substrate-binding protein
MNTLGAHHDFMLREFLFRNGLAPQQIEQVSRIVIPPVTAELSLRQRQVEVATLGGVVRDKALERGGLRRLFSDHDLYGRFTAGSLVFREDFIREHPQTVRAFVAATARAIEWAREQPRAEVQARMRAIIAARQRSEDDSLVRYWQSTGVSGQGGLIAEREFEVWIDWLVKDGQLAAGALRPADLYTNEFNPYAEQTS